MSKKSLRRSALALASTAVLLPAAPAIAQDAPKLQIGGTTYTKWLWGNLRDQGAMPGERLGGMVGWTAAGAADDEDEVDGRAAQRRGDRGSVAADRLEVGRLEDILELEDDVLRAGIGQLAEAIHDPGGGLDDRHPAWGR